MTKAELEQYVKERIYPNNMGDITAEVLQETLLTIIAGLVSDTEVSKAISDAVAKFPIIALGESAEFRGTSNNGLGKATLFASTNVEADADYSVIAGAGHTVIGQNRVIVGGTNNRVTASSSNSIVAGNGNDVVGSSNSIVAGNGNTTESDSDRSIIAGKDNKVSGLDCIVAGNNCKVSQNGAIVAGEGARAKSGTYLAIGQGSDVNLFEVTTAGVYYKGQKIV